MRQPIECNHLNKSYTVDLKTGEKTESKAKMMMMPAKEGTCSECATAHEPELPHNAQSLFYQYRFYDQHGRWPNWLDAMSHCSEDMKSQWTVHLKNLGVDVSGGKVHAEKKVSDKVKTRKKVK